MRIALVLVSRHQSIQRSILENFAILAGKFVTVGKLPKIIALDPAGPFFSVDKPDGRLNETDALYVECVHTSELGFFHPLGDVDFYANGGRIQPGCSWDLVSL